MLVHLLVRRAIEVDELVAGVGQRPDDLVELERDRLGLAVGGVLDHEHHPERDDGRGRVDEQLPGVGEPEQRSGHHPADDEDHREDQGPQGAQPGRDGVGDPVGPVADPVARAPLGRLGHAARAQIEPPRAVDVVLRPRGGSALDLGQLAEVRARVGIVARLLQPRVADLALDDVARVADLGLGRSVLLALLAHLEPPSGWVDVEPGRSVVGSSAGLEWSAADPRKDLSAQPSRM